MYIARRSCKEVCALLSLCRAAPHRLRRLRQLAAEWAPSPPARDPQASSESQQLGVPTPRRVGHIRRRRGGGGAERRVGVGVGVQRRRLPQGEEEGHVLAGLEEQPVARGA